MAFPVTVIRRPRALEGLANGRIPADKLVSIPGLGGGPVVRLIEPAARAWRAMTTTALSDGHVLKATSAADSFRPFEVQERIFRDRYRTDFKAGAASKVWNGVRWYHWSGATAAVPGTSNHGWAMAVDTGEESDRDPATENLDAGTLAWLVTRAADFGWSWELQSEPWHLHYWAGDAIPAAVLDFEQGKAPGASPRDEEDEVVRVIWFKGPDGGAHAYAVAGVNGKHLSQAALDLHKFLGNPPINSEAEPFDTSWQDGLAIVDGPCKNVP